MKAKTLAKRIYHLPGLFWFEQRRWRLCWQGARIARGVALSPMLASGSKKYLSIGEQSFVGRVTLHLHRGLTIGRRVVINDGVTIFTASHDVNSASFQHTYGEVVIGDYVWIATGASIMPGVTIGRGAVVGAFAVVTKDVPELSVVGGNPAREIKRRASALDYDPVAFVAPFEAWHEPC